MAPKHNSSADAPPRGNSSSSRFSIEEVKNLFMRPFSGKSGRSSDRSSNISFSGLRWSLEDMKDTVFRRSAASKEKKKRKQQMTDEERKARRQERLEARKEKKSAREKERRSNVNGLFDQLGGILGVKKDDKKGARLSILSAAVDKLKEQKKSEAFDEDDDEDDYDEYKR